MSELGDLIYEELGRDPRLAGSLAETRQLAERVAARIQPHYVPMRVHLDIFGLLAAVVHQQPPNSIRITERTRSEEAQSRKPFTVWVGAPR